MGEFINIELINSLKVMVESTDESNRVLARQLLINIVLDEEDYSDFLLLINCGEIFMYANLRILAFNLKDVLKCMGKDILRAESSWSKSNAFICVYKYY